MSVRRRDCFTRGTVRIEKIEENSDATANMPDLVGMSSMNMKKLPTQIASDRGHEFISARVLRLLSIRLIVSPCPMHGPRPQAVIWSKLRLSNRRAE